MLTHDLGALRARPQDQGCLVVEPEAKQQVQIQPLVEPESKQHIQMQPVVVSRQLGIREQTASCASALTEYTSQAMQDLINALSGTTGAQQCWS